MAKRKDVIQEARKHTEGAIKTLVGIMNQPKSPETARIRAAEILLNRGYGMPKTTIAGDPDNPVIPSTIKVQIVDPKP